MINPVKKIIYICDHNPFKKDYGAQQRTRLIFDLLCKIGSVDLVCFTSDDLPEIISNQNYKIKYFGELQKNSNSVIKKRLLKIINLFYSCSPFSVYSKNKNASKIVHDLLKENKYDIVFFRYMKNAFMCGITGGDNVFVDVDDLPEQSFFSYANNRTNSKIKYYEYLFYAKRAAYHTQRFSRRVKHLFFTSEAQLKTPNSSFLPNIPYPTSIEPKKNDGQISAREPKVLFVGYLSHGPNLHGLILFIEHIWPYILKSIPAAEFYIAGKGLPDSFLNKWSSDKSINVLGFVENLEPLYKMSKVVVVPVYYGAGTNIKVLEAMARKKAVVVSAFSAKAFNNDLTDHSNAMIANNKEDFAKKVVLLLQDKQLNSSISQAADKIITEKYSYTFFEKAIKSAILNTSNVT